MYCKISLTVLPKLSSWSKFEPGKIMELNPKLSKFLLLLHLLATIVPSSFLLVARSSSVSL